MALRTVNALAPAPASNPSAPNTYHFLRNDEIKRSENDELRVRLTAPLGLHMDHSGRLAIGYGYDLLARSAATVAVELAPYLPSGVTVSATQIAILDAYRLQRPLSSPGHPLNGQVPTRAQVESSR